MYNFYNLEVKKASKLILTLFLMFFFKFIYLFIYLVLRDTETEKDGEGDRTNPQQDPHCQEVQSLTWDLNS